LDVIRSADWVIDLGPEGGDRGGQIVAEGTPEQIAASRKSHTGQYLRQHATLTAPIAAVPTRGASATASRSARK
jgi:excinuclease ABC subunit A